MGAPLSSSSVTATKWFGSPGGGGKTPSMSEGRKKSSLIAPWSCFEGWRWDRLPASSPDQTQKASAQGTLSWNSTKHKCGHVIAIRPDAELGIILPSSIERRKSYRYHAPVASPVWETAIHSSCGCPAPSGHGEMADDPPVSEPIIDDYRIARPDLAQVPPKPNQTDLIGIGPRSDVPVSLSKTCRALFTIWTY